MYIRLIPAVLYGIYRNDHGFSHHACITGNWIVLSNVVYASFTGRNDRFLTPACKHVEIWPILAESLKNATFTPLSAAFEYVSSSSA